MKEIQKVSNNLKKKQKQFLKKKMENQRINRKKNLIMKESLIKIKSIYFFGVPNKRKTKPIFYCLLPNWQIVFSEQCCCCRSISCVVVVVVPFVFNILHLINSFHDPKTSKYLIH